MQNAKVWMYNFQVYEYPQDPYWKMDLSKHFEFNQTQVDIHQNVILIQLYKILIALLKFDKSERHITPIRLH